MENISKKNIILVIDSLGCGGAEKSLISLLPLLDYNKYDIDLMIISRGGLFEKYVPKEVNIIGYEPHNGKQINKVIYKLLQIIFSIKLRCYTFFKIKHHGAEQYWSIMQHGIKMMGRKYDIAIAYQQGFPTYYVATKVNATKKIAWINADVVSVGYSTKFNRHFYNKYTNIVTVSEKLNDIVDSNYRLGNKVKVISDIINPQLIHNFSKDIISTRHTHKSVLVTVGRLVPLKGHSLAIDAAKILKETEIDFVWYFVGDGPSRNNIEELISVNNLTEYVVLLGEQANPYPYMNVCDIYVQPSIFEGFGITVAEAKILQKPIVCTNFDVVHDQLTNEVNGLIVNKDGVEIANAILRLINDTPLREMLISNLKKEENKTSITEPAKVMALIDAE